jgi:hypothetical protein
VPIYRAMVVFENAETALPEDRFINTFHFLTMQEHEPSSPLIAARLVAFYNNGPNQIISSKVDRGNNKAQVRTYNLSDAMPREPIVTPWTLAPAPSPSGALPNEVAVCVSFYADRNLPRNRGRVFIGPLDRVVMESGSGDMRVSSSYRTTLANAVEQLDSTVNVTWCVYSERDGQAKPVTHGWIDNAFDTQRRRGKDPDSRLSFDLSSVAG